MFLPTASPEIAPVLTVKSCQGALEEVGKCQLTFRDNRGPGVAIGSARPISQLKAQDLIRINPYRSALIQRSSHGQSISLPAAYVSVKV